jgi:hypothetical protein
LAARAVELVDIHSVDAILKPLHLTLMAFDHFVMLLAFVGVAGRRVVGLLRSHHPG